MTRMNRESGVVSLFVVIFATLLITVITVGFLRLMVQNQQEASAQDLAQSAYDSAQAGAQDAERALLAYESCVAQQQGGSSITCSDPTKWSACNNIILAQLAGAGNTTVDELPVAQTTGGQVITNINQASDGQTTSSNLNQAYTCVKVALDTDDVTGVISDSGQKIIPLSSTAPFAAVKISWFSKADLPSNVTNGHTNLQMPATGVPLLQQWNGANGWDPARPSVERVQLMQFSSNGFKLSDFDNTAVSGQSNANTLFLYPTGTSGVNPGGYTPTPLSFALDARRTPTGSPIPVTCLGDLSGGGYSCSAIISVPTPINAGTPTAYLRLTPMYNNSHFTVQLLANAADPTSVVQFHNVQPAIDSTGRANDLFKRIVTRVDLLNNSLPYPSDAVDLTGNFCKDFAVTNDATQYAAINAGATCTP